MIVDSEAGSGELKLGAGSTVQGTGTLNFDGVQTVTLTGDFNWDSTTTLTNFRNSQVTFERATAADDLLLDGLLQVQSEDDVFNVAVQVGAGGELELLGVSGLKTTTFNEDVTNGGLLELRGGINGGGDEGVVLQLGGAATLTNLAGGTIQSSGSYDSRTIIGDIINQGTIDVDYDLTVNGDVTNTGLVDLAVARTLTLNSLLDNQAGGVFKINGSSVSFEFVNFGLLEVRGSSTLTSAPGEFTQFGNVLISSDDSFGNATLTVANGFDNDGTIKLDDAGTGWTTSLVVSNGTLVNNDRIEATNTGGSGAGSRVLTADINNVGTLDIDHKTTINGTLFDSDGAISTIDVAAGKTLTLNLTTTRIGSTTSLLGGGTIDLVGGQTLELTSDVDIAGGDPTLKFGGTVTVSGAGTLSILSGAMQELTADTINTDLDLQTGGQLTVRQGSTLGTQAGGFTQSGLLLLTSDDTFGGASLTVANGFTNDGTIKLDDAGTGWTTSLVVSNGTLVNNDRIEATNTGGSGTGSRVLTADIDNVGTLDIDHKTTINGTLFESDGAGSTIDVAAGKTLTLNLTTTRIGSTTSLLGGGTIDLVGGQTLELTSDVDIAGGDPTLKFGGTVTVSGAGTLSILSGAMQELTADTINTDLDLQTGGQLTVRQGSTLGIQAGGFAQSGLLLLTSDDTFGGASLTVANGFTNDGTITLDDAGTGWTTSLVVSSGTLVNNDRIEVTNTGGGGGGSRSMTLSLDNHGDVVIGHNTSLGVAGAVHGNDGFLKIGSGVTLTVTGTSLTQASGGELSGSGTLDVSATTFTNDGWVTPGGRHTVGTLTIDGDLNQSASSVLTIDVSNDTTHDLLVVSELYDFEGVLDLNFADGHGLSGGEAFSIVTYGTLAGGGFSTFEHNLAHGYEVTASATGSTTGTIDVTITADFEKTFDGDADPDFDWNTAANWHNDTVPNTLPAAGEDVLINGAFAVTHAMASNDTINSLSLEASASLNLSDGSIILNQNSRTGPATVLTVGGSASTNLVVGDTGNDALTIDGTLIWDDGQLTGAGNVFVNGTIQVSNGTARTLDVGLVLAGSAEFGEESAGTDIINGSGTIINKGTLVAKHQTDINLGFANHEGATLSLVGNTLNSHLTFASGFTNDGTIRLDNLHATNVRDATLTLDAGTLINNGTIGFYDTNGNLGSRSIEGNLNNTGTLDVQYSGAVKIVGATFNTVGGSINIESGEELEVDVSTVGGTTVIGAMTELTGAGLLRFSGGTVANRHEINLDDDFVLTGTMPQWALDGQILLSGSGTSLTVASGASLELSADNTDAGLTLRNQGTVILEGNEVVIAGDFFNEAGALLTVAGQITSTNQKSFASSFTNEGTIEFDQTIAGIQNRIEIEGGTGTLTNLGTFKTLDTVAGNRIFLGVFDNQGLLEVVNSDLDLNASAAVTHFNSGTIDIGDARVLTLGASNSLTNEASGSLIGTGTLDASAADVTLTNLGTIAPGASAGVLTILGDVGFAGTSEVNIEIGGLAAGTAYDQLSVSGVADLRGRLNVSVINSFAVANGNTFAILLTAGLMGSSFDEANGLIIDADMVFDLVENGDDLELVTVDVDQAFTAGADTLVGVGLARDVLRGGAGDDDLQGISGDDILYGEDGDDVLQVDSAFKRVDGGAGTDTLQLKDALDLRDGAGTRIDRVEILSLADGDSDVVDLDASAIRLMVDGHNQLTGFADSLVVLGNEGDVLRAHGDFVPVGSDVLDPGDGLGGRSFNIYEEAGVRLYVDDTVLLEVHRGDSTQAVYGSRFDDLIDSGQGDDDALFGADGDDQLVFDATDSVVDGGAGIDSLLVESIDLTGVTSIANIEQIDMTNGSADTLQLDISDLLSFVGDNELDSILPNGESKLVIEGDATDTVILDGQDLSDISGNVLPAGISSDFTAQDYFGSSEQYVKFVSAGVELYVHENLVDPDPVS